MIDFWKFFQNRSLDFDRSKESSIVKTEEEPRIPLEPRGIWRLKNHSPIFGVGTRVLGEATSRSVAMMARRRLLRHAGHAVSAKVRVILEIPRIHVVPARRAATVPGATDRNGTDRVPVYRRFGWHFHFFFLSSKFSPNFQLYSFSKNQPFWIFSHRNCTYIYILWKEEIFLSQDLLIVDNSREKVNRRKVPCLLILLTTFIFSTFHRDGC